MAAFPVFRPHPNYPEMDEGIRVRILQLYLVHITALVSQKGLKSKIQPTKKLNGNLFLSSCAMPTAVVWHAGTLLSAALSHAGRFLTFDLHLTPSTLPRVQKTRTMSRPKHCCVRIQTPACLSQLRHSSCKTGVSTNLTRASL